MCVRAWVWVCVSLLGRRLAAVAAACDLLGSLASARCLREHRPLTDSDDERAGGGERRTQTAMMGMYRICRVAAGSRWK